MRDFVAGGRRSPRRNRWVVALVAACAVACSPAPAVDVPSEIHSDTAPLTRRFPAIGVPEAVAWVTWTNASRDVPGPTTYWIDAVITLHPQAAAALARDTTAEGRMPDVAEALRSAVGPGPFVTGAALNEALSTDGWTATGYLDRRRNQLVLNAVDD
ncbi:hypothetical protein [Mycolicibacterium austroafricanum]|uniref:hypothetical protein n=1 Tax=Mycolicibacterium austroafricanum TaxID=39687 RepID=UPI0011AE688A|nr:hypothetical protein [Mycolicibacterium austroafricanum]QZY47815.1 hypothetical protein K5L12_08980 [Mycolicibacterium austroafricanum]